MASGAWFGIVFAILGVAAASLMLWLWGFPYDEEKGRSTAPRALVMLHRVLGYGFAGTFVMLMIGMVPRLWTYTEELPARSALHAFLGVAVGVVLVLKVAVIRFFPAFRRFLPVFGITLVVLALTAVSLPLAGALRTAWLGHRAVQPAAAELARERLAALPQWSAEDARRHATPAGIAAGRTAMFARCTLCHDLRRVMAGPRTAAQWEGTVNRMADKAGLAGHPPPGIEERRSITAFLSAARGLDATPATSSVPSAPGAGGAAPAAVSVPDAPADFPGRDAALAVLTRHCATCHRGGSAPKGLRLDTLESAAASTAVAAGEPAGSELIRRVRGDSQPRMPIGGPPWLDQAEVRALEDWILSLRGTDSPAATVTPQGTTPEPPREAIAATLPAPPDGTPVTFRHVQPILAAHCVKCHAPQGIMGPAPENLLLTDWQSLLRRDGRAVVIPGHPAASNLLRRVTGHEQPRMPFDGPPWLSEEEVGLLRRWIADGARNEEGTPASVPVGAEVRINGTLESRWVVDGIPLRLTPGTEVRDATPGSRVEVRATVEPDGGLVVRRLRGR